MRYSKADPEIRRLMREWHSNEADGLVGSLAADGSLQEMLVPLLVVLRGEELPKALQGKPRMRVAPQTWAAYLALPEIDALHDAPEVSYFERGAPIAFALDETIPALGIPDIPEIDQKNRGRGVIIGIIDDGLDWRQPDFIDGDSSRILYLWDQTLKREADDPEFEDPEHQFGGVEYTNKYLTEALTDPEKVVRHEPREHGTHVTGIAAGNGRSGSSGGREGGSYVGVAPHADIIFVAARKEDRNVTLTNSTNLTAAVAYIFSKALKKGRPCVINMSLGQNLGAHDGESILERTIDSHLTSGGYAAAVAAGNQHQPAQHATLKFTEGQRRDLQLRIAADHAKSAPTIVEIWYSAVDQMGVVVQCPHDKKHPPLEEVRAPYDDRLTTKCDVGVEIDSVRFAPENGEARIRIRISGDASAGTWKIGLIADRVRHGTVDAWVERSGKGYTQPEFIGEGTGGETRRSTTTPATSHRCVAVGNLNRAAKLVSPNSSRGGTRDGRTKPDLVAPGSGIVSTKAKGTPETGVRLRMSGTSMATPIVAGVIALMLQKNPELTSWVIRSILRASSDPPEKPDAAYGFGSLNVKQALELTPAGEKTIAREDFLQEG